MTMEKRPSLAEQQELLHGLDHDYVVGSPHLRHEALRSYVEDRIADAVRGQITDTGRCRVLEIGAGHGSFTDVAVGAGATVTVTEMSGPSAEFLRNHFTGDRSVMVVFDPDGEEALRRPGEYDLILLISVLHHIPDYVTAIRRLVDERLAPGGGVLTFQDPLWYPTQTRVARMTSWGCYYLWRVGQGHLSRGIHTHVRRFRGYYDDNEPSDTVEYHVMRDGIDHRGLVALLESRFDHVSLDRYFSTQAPVLQRVGSKVFPPNTFAIAAAERQPS
ncbi:class I SAM-dependent methyltransferase [Williamsia serinedens]|uniref:class I SAM-dependent methyltransferase n=1 Tax=Williamsia serinedens TaxID=391736 RepID=UPI0020A27683|nr:methyltransferase domain-containing protein [Williamsia serinedens]